jgi:hypothetical protein
MKRPSLAPWRRAALTFSAALLLSTSAAAERRQIGDLLLEDIPREAEAYGRAVADHIETRSAYEFLGWRVGATGHTFLRAGNLYSAEAAYGAFTRVVDLP